MKLPYDGLILTVLTLMRTLNQLGSSILTTSKTKISRLGEEINFKLLAIFEGYNPYTIEVWQRLQAEITQFNPVLWH